MSVSSSVLDQSRLRGTENVVGHFFLAGVHVAQYPGQVWLGIWSGMVTTCWVFTTEVVASCENIKEVSVW